MADHRVTTWKALCAELFEIVEGEYSGTSYLLEWRRSIRNALAQSDQEEPTDEELLELLSRISGLPEPDSYTIDGGRISPEPSEILGFARAVLQQWGRPTIQGEEQ